MGYSVQGIEKRYIGNNLKHVYDGMERMEAKKENVIPPSYLEENREDKEAG